MHQKLLAQLKVEVQALESEEMRHQEQLRLSEEAKAMLEVELKRVIEVIIPEMKVKLEQEKEENDSLNAKISFLQLERGAKVVKMLVL